VITTTCICALLATWLIVLLLLCLVLLRRGGRDRESEVPDNGLQGPRVPPDTNAYGDSIRSGRARGCGPRQRATER